MASPVVSKRRMAETEPPSSQLSLGRLTRSQTRLLNEAGIGPEQQQSSDIPPPRQPPKKKAPAPPPPAPLPEPQSPGSGPASEPSAPPTEEVPASDSIWPPLRHLLQCRPSSHHPQRRYRLSLPSRL